jgi:hypothetical protein
VAQSEEDLLLKEQLELYILRAQDSDPGVQKLALESMRYTIHPIQFTFQVLVYHLHPGISFCGASSLFPT